MCSRYCEQSFAIVTTALLSGAIADRTFEHLAPSDIAITRTRRVLVKAATDYAKDGTLPKSARDPRQFEGVRGGWFTEKDGVDWLDGYRKQIAKAPLKYDAVQAADSTADIRFDRVNAIRAAIADGSALITENLFEARFRFTQELGRLGAGLLGGKGAIACPGVGLAAAVDVVGGVSRAGERPFPFGAPLVLAHHEDLVRLVRRPRRLEDQPRPVVRPVRLQSNFSSA